MATGSIEALYKILYIVTLFHYLLEKVATVKLSYITVTQLGEKKERKSSVSTTLVSGRWQWGEKPLLCGELYSNKAKSHFPFQTEAGGDPLGCECLLLVLMPQRQLQYIASPPGVFPAIGNGSLVIWVV